MKTKFQMEIFSMRGLYFAIAQMEHISEFKLFNQNPK